MYSCWQPIFSSSFANNPSVGHLQREWRVQNPSISHFGSQPRMLCEPDQGEGLHGLHDPLDDSHNDPRRLRPLAPANSMSASVLQSTVVEHLPGRLGCLLWRPCREWSLNNMRRLGRAGWGMGIRADACAGSSWSTRWTTGIRPGQRQRRNGRTTRLLPQPFMNPMPWISFSTHVRGPRVLPNTGTHDSLAVAG